MEVHTCNTPCAGGGIQQSEPAAGAAAYGGTGSAVATPAEMATAGQSSTTHTTTALPVHIQDSQDSFTYSLQDTGMNELENTVEQQQGGQQDKLGKPGFQFTQEVRWQSGGKQESKPMS